MHVGSEPEIICSIIRIHHWNQCCRAGLFFTSSSFSLFAGSNKYPLLFASNYLEQIFIHTLTRNNSFIFKIFSLFAFDIDQCQKFGTKEEKSFQIFFIFHLGRNRTFNPSPDKMFRLRLCNIWDIYLVFTHSRGDGFERGLQGLLFLGQP